MCRPIDIYEARARVTGKTDDISTTHLAILRLTNSLYQERAYSVLCDPNLDRDAPAYDSR